MPRRLASASCESCKSRLTLLYRRQSPMHPESIYPGFGGFLLSLDSDTVADFIAESSVICHGR